MPRRLLLLLVIIALAPGTWLRSTPARYDRAERLTVNPLAIPQHCCRIGPLRLSGAWHLTSRNELFGSYSALHENADGSLLALSDTGYYLRFPAPPKQPGRVEFGRVPANWAVLHNLRDIESLTTDPRSGQAWIAVESGNVIFRFDPLGRQNGMAAPPAMHDWPHNLGPEAMVRLGDGRFVVLGESYRNWLDRTRHPALLFSADPVERGTVQSFTFRGPPGYRPTDMAQLPDGRVLILIRQVLQPFPIRFSIRLILADPAQIVPGQDWSGIDLGEVPALSLVDNYEGLAISARPGRPIRVWMISDNNASAFERVLLLAWDLNPADLPPSAPPMQKGAPTAASTPLHSAGS